MAYDKQHTKDYYQLNVKLDYDRDADVISFLQTVDNKRRTICKAIETYIIIMILGKEIDEDD